MRVKAGRAALDAAPNVRMHAVENGVLWVALRDRSEQIPAKVAPKAKPTDEDEIELEHQRSSSHRALARALGHAV